MMIPEHTRAVFFDAVGTLVFPEPPAPIAYAETARRHGLELPPDEFRRRFRAAFRNEESADQAAGWKTSEAREETRWRRIVAESLHGVPDPEQCFRELFEHFASPAAWRLNPDTAAVFTSLQNRGLVLGIGSNYDARLWHLVNGFPELAPLRDRVVISAAVGYRKPAREFFTMMARAAGCEPQEVLFVGDDLGNDYDGATAAGMPAVLLDPQDEHPDIPHRIVGLRELIPPA